MQEAAALARPAGPRFPDFCTDLVGIAARPDNAADPRQPAVGFDPGAVVAAKRVCRHNQNILDVDPGDAPGPPQVAPGERLLGHHETICEQGDDGEDEGPDDYASEGDVTRSSAGAIARLDGNAQADESHESHQQRLDDQSPSRIPVRPHELIMCIGAHDLRPEARTPAWRGRCGSPASTCC